MSLSLQVRPGWDARRSSRLRMSDLSPNRARLVRLFQSVNFGRIENLHIRDHEPHFSIPPVVVRDIKFGGENIARPESRLHDFVVREEVREVFALFDQLSDCVIESIHIRHGLPYTASVRQAVESL